MARTESSLVKRLRRELAEERAMRVALEGRMVLRPVTLHSVDHGEQTMLVLEGIAPHGMPIVSIPSLETMGERVTVDLYKTSEWL